MADDALEEWWRVNGRNNITQFSKNATKMVRDYFRKEQLEHFLS